MNDIEIAVKYAAKARSSADRNIPFMLSFYDYKRLLNTRKCYYSGVELTFEASKDNSFTIDRIDASIGYVPGNVVACSLKMNQKKKDFTLDELRMVFKKLKKRL